MFKTYFFLKKYKPNIIHFFLPTSYIIAGFPSILFKNTKLLMSRRSLNFYQKKYLFVSFLEKILHSKMETILKPHEWKIYNFLYIKNYDEMTTAKKMGYKVSEKNKSPGYKQIKIVKKKIIGIAKDLLEKGEIDIFW